jgi:signal transduction histidine kinase
MEYFLWYFPVSALVNAVTSTVLGAYVLLTNYKVRVSRYIFYFCLSVAAWSYPYFMWQMANDSATALFWSRLLMYGAIFTSISYLHLVIVFLGLDKDKFYKFILFVFYFFTFVWIFANVGNLFVLDVEPKLYFKFWPIPGPFYLPYLVAFGFHVSYASVLLLKRFLASKGLVRDQSKLLLIGIFFAFVGGSTNFPLWYGINLAPWGNGVVTIYVILTVYAMMKYKFMDLKVVAAEIFTGFFLTIVFVDVFLSRNYAEFVFRLISLVIVAVFGVMLIRSVRREVRRREEITSMAHSLERANFRLQEIDRQKTEFLSIASHQLRTPLSILKGYIELIKDGAYGKPSTKLLHTLHDMDESNERLVKLVDDFLDISRIEQGRTKFSFADKDIKELVLGVVHELSERARAVNLAIKYKPSIKPFLVNMDDEKVRHVVFNYIDNAIKYCGGKKGDIEVRVEEDEEGVSVRVIDKGIGFSKKTRLIFFKNFTAART